MGLEGYLEDLGISEILQIISLSKKSGMLSLSNEQETGTITFLEGQVVRATSTRSPETLGRLLIQHNIVTAQQVEAALVRQSGLRCHQPLGAILAATCQVPPAAIEAIVKRQIEEIVSGFFTWDKGSFLFQLGEPQAFGSTSVNPFDFMLEKGISSPRLVVKGRHFAGHRDGVDDADDAVLEAEIEFLEKRLDDEGLMLLRGMLAELEYSSMGSGIILLILRYASEIMNRAIIFDVRGRQLVGLGQFGLTGLSTTADELVRELRLDVEPDSLFSRALQEKNVLCSALEQSVAEQTLSKILGGVPDEVFLGPLVSDGKVVAMLYGDNYPDNGPIKAATTFGIFLSQAGLAMEQALQDQ
ncbi:MAG: DUF4388 domain-containing protein [Deltaproteobacteria bacterium]|nr:DUF4388 domain-containing protein [Deltaproteobacteria bacterium]